jgi:single-strand DNA-binding protein
MGSVNKVILVGNLGRDAELKFTPSGFPISSFSLATTDRRKDKDNNWQEKTEWHRIKLLGKQAESLQDYLKKGKQIYVEGRLETRSWDDKDGQKKYMTEILADRIQLLGGRGEGGGGGRSGRGGGEDLEHYEEMGGASGGGSGPSDLTDDDIPF